VRIDEELMEIWPNEVCDTVNEFTKRMESTTEEAKSMICKVQEDMTRYYN